MFSTTLSTTKNRPPGAQSTESSAQAAAADIRQPQTASEKKESYEKVQRRQRAELILGQYDLLMKYAVENQIVSQLMSCHLKVLSRSPWAWALTKREQSIPQTRAYFQKVALGVEVEPVIKNWFSR